MQSNRVRLPGRGPHGAMLRDSATVQQGQVGCMPYGCCDGCCADGPGSMVQRCGVPRLTTYRALFAVRAPYVTPHHTQTSPQGAALRK